MAVSNETLLEIYNRYQPPLENPSVSISFVGVSGTAVYYYVITAVGDTGETDGTKVQVQGFEILNADNYVSLSWIPVKNAKRYRIYGRSQDSLGLLIETTETSWNDYGVVVPDTTKIPPTENKTGRTNWESLEFLPGRSLQSAELNELQAILADAQEKLAKTIFNDGDIIQGCNIVVDTVNKKAYISAGKVFIRGRVREVDGAVLDITGVGEEKIGILVEERYIDAEDDSILLDPAQGYPGYATQGALRKILNFTWVKDNPDAILVYRLQDGVVVKRYQGIVYSELEKMLARRTSDIVGDCIVYGFNIFVKDHETRRDKVVIELTGGKAYVDGYEVYKPDKVEIETDTAIDSDTVSAEIVSPREDGSYVYEVDARPVKKVNYVTGSFFSSETRTVPSATDENGWYVDNLPHASIDEVVGLWDNSSKTTQYVLNTDYRVVGNTIRLNPAKFDVGQTYYIEYYYFQELVKGKRSLASQIDSFNTDGTTKSFTTTKADVVNERWRFSIKVWLEDSGGNEIRDYEEGVDYTVDLGRTETSIGNAVIAFNTAPSSGNVLKVQYYYWNHDVEGDYVSVDSYLNADDPFGDYLYEAVIDKNVVDLRTAGNKPSKLNLIVGYEYFLPQRAYLLLDKDGNIEILRGRSSRFPAKPVKPAGKLVLYELYFNAFGDKKNVIPIFQKRYSVLKMYDLNVMKDTMFRMQYDMAMIDLEKHVSSISGARKGVFVDGFLDAKKLDYDKSNCSLDTVNGWLLLPRVVNPFSLVYDASKTTAYVSSKCCMKNYTREPWISQLKYNDYIALQLTAFRGNFGILNIYPTRDIWTETKYSVDWGASLSQVIIVDESDYVLSKGGFDAVSDWAEVARQDLARILNLDPDRLRYEGCSRVPTFPGDIRPPNYCETYYFNYVSGVTTNVTIVPQIRSRKIYVNLFSRPLTEFICLIQGKQVPLSLASQSEINFLKWTARGLSGETSGAVKTDINGWVTCKFTMPSLQTSQVDVVLQSIDGTIRCSKKYVGYGTVYEYVEHVAHVALWQKEPIEDPISQVFIPDRDGFIESVDIWIVGVPDTEEMLCVSIKEVENGVIRNDKVVGTSLGKATSQIMSEANISSTYRILQGDPSETNGRVRFIFDPPVFVKGGHVYALSVEGSPNFLILAVRSGKPLLGSIDGSGTKGVMVDRRPYEGDVMMSIDGERWEVYKDVNLVFRINKAKFNLQEEVIAFSPIDLSVVDGGGFLQMLSSEVIPVGCDVIWEWSEDGTHWSEFSPMRKLNEPRVFELGDTASFKKVINTLYVRARLLNISDYVSPVILLDELVLRVGRFYSPGVYESIVNYSIGDENFENIKIWFWLKDEGNIDAVKVSFDGGNTWFSVPFVKNYSVPGIVGGVMEYEYGGSLSALSGGSISEANNFKVRIEFSEKTTQVSPMIGKLRVVTW